MENLFRFMDLKIEITGSIIFNQPNFGCKNRSLSPNFPNWTRDFTSVPMRSKLAHNLCETSSENFANSCSERSSALRRLDKVKTKGAFSYFKNSWWQFYTAIRSRSLTPSRDCRVLGRLSHLSTSRSCENHFEIIDLWSVLEVSDFKSLIHFEVTDSVRMVSLFR